MLKSPFSIGKLKPTPGIVDEYFNGGEGLSIDDIDGKLPGEERGIQDDAPMAATAVGNEVNGKKSKAKSKKKLDKAS